MMEKTLKQHALDCAASGMAVFPLRPRGKEPAFSGWQEAATQDKEQIERWWSSNPEYNVGIACGEPSGGLVVLDLDVDDGKGRDGVAYLRKWAEENKVTLPQTATVKTGRGGLHLYFRDDKVQYKNHVNLFNDEKGWVDVRAGRGYVVAAGSIHPNGTAYGWKQPPVICGIQPLPAEIGHLLKHADKKDAESPPALPYAIGDIPEGSRTSSLFKLLSSLQSKGLSDDAIVAAIRAENDARCIPPLTETELEREVFPALHRYIKGTAPYPLDRDYNTDAARLVAMLCEMHPESNKRYGRNDLGNANLFADLSKGVVVYVPDRGKWYAYDGTRWACDAGNSATERFCKTVANALMSYTVQYIPDGTVKMEYLKFAATWQKYHTRTTIIRDAASVSPVRLATFDADDYILNCRNGTLNLRTMAFHEHSPGDWLTKHANVTYDPQARCERWEQFVDEVMCGDKALGHYLQKLLGSCLTGDTSFEQFYILYGVTTRNGKGTLCESIGNMLGDYARNANPDVISTNRKSNPSGPSEDIASLAGARAVILSEPRKGMVLDASVVKTLTGGNVIKARFLNENGFEFKPKLKLVIETNHLPVVNDATVFTSGRCKVVPFNRHFEEHEQDTRLKSTLTQPGNMSGILNWCIEGLMLLRKEGWCEPDAVRNAIHEYEEDSDLTGQFIDDCLVEDASGECDVKFVHMAYQDWCANGGFRAEDFSPFRQSLLTAGLSIKRKRPAGSSRTANKKYLLMGYTLQK